MSASIQSLLAQCDRRIRLLEAHDCDSFQIISNAVGSDGQRFQGVWISGLTQTTYLGIPDTELLSPLKRASLLSWLHDYTRDKGRLPLCIAFDCDSGGDVAEISNLMALLVMLRVSMIVIEDKSVDKPGEKVNSLHGASHCQYQADMYKFADVIKAFAAAASMYGSERGMMVTARIESFTVRFPKQDQAEEEQSIQASLEDALTRAYLYTKAGANAIMIHSKSSKSNEVLAFLTRYRSRDATTPVVVVPTTYSYVTEETLYKAGANVVIYANHLMRAKIYAVRRLFNEALAQQWRQQQRQAPTFFQDEALEACVVAQNFGCLLQKLSANGDLNDEAADFLDKAKIRAIQTMAAVAQRLLKGQSSGTADSHLISIQDLLEINNHKVSLT
ncbi:MAG: hypothetical protein M1836_007932 [Candelina mexicana]|nr:MAG: hypothetical protein M1836_007932 [Candelina mexicana]